MRQSEIADGGDESLTYSELSRGMPVLNKASGCQCGNNGTGTLPCRESLGLPTAVCTVRLTKSLYSKNLFPTFCGGSWSLLSLTMHDSEPACPSAGVGVWLWKMLGRRERQ